MNKIPSDAGHTLLTSTLPYQGRVKSYLVPGQCLQFVTSFIRSHFFRLNLVKNPGKGVPALARGQEFDRSSFGALVAVEVQVWPLPGAEGKRI